MRLRAAIIVIFFSIIGQVANAGEFYIARSSNSESNAVVAFSLSSREYLVAYYKAITNPWVSAKPGIYIQRVKDTGELIGSPKLIYHSANLIHNFLPKISIAYSTYTQRYVVTWTWIDKDFRSAIYSININAFGTVEDEPNKVIARTSKMWDSRTIHDHVIVYNPVLHNFVLIWSQSLPSTYASNRVLFASNLGVWGNRQVGQTIRLSRTSTWDAFYDYRPNAAANPKLNQIITVWEHLDQGPAQIHGTLISGDASQHRVSFIVSDYGTNPYAAYNETSGLYLVVYEGYENGKSAIKARHIRANENRTYTKSYEFVLVNSYSASKPVRSPKIAYDSITNQFIMAYDRSWESDRDIYYALFYDLGDAIEDRYIFDPGIFPQTYYKDQYNPSVAYNKYRNEFIVIWHHQYDATDVDIHGMILGNDGSPK